MMGRIKDLTGQRFGRLVAVKYLHKKRYKPIWHCRCDCGKEKNVDLYKLLSGHTKSCGCYNRDCRIKGSGVRRYTRLYRIYMQMKERTENENKDNYADYGGRGIKICDDWLEDYESFKTWALTNGYTDDLSIDRIDNDKGYSPDNCRWTTKTGQANNKRNNRLLTYKGETHNISKWAEIRGVDRSIIDNRLRRGYSIEQTFEEPVIKRGRYNKRVNRQ